LVSQLVDAVVAHRVLQRGACPVEEDFMEAFAAFSCLAAAPGGASHLKVYKILGGFVSW